jgi:hypothetical protein
LLHRLFRSHRTGEVIKPIFTRYLTHHGGTTTSFALSTISGTLMLIATSDFPTRLISSRTLRTAKDVGRFRIAGMAKRTLKWNASANQPLEHAASAAGIEVVGPRK